MSLVKVTFPAPAAGLLVWPIAGAHVATVRRPPMNRARTMT